ncbi:MAG: CBS domain-containing protein [Thiohalocapsa sp.]|nr:CBS domain-containing protein [Thiohalocapsa sp.]MCF7989772.1 CBS domain-containing protein [Thiohalocapsa sp.]
MDLQDLIVPTAVATPDMTVAELFRECAAKQVPGIPFRDACGRITGKASIRHVLKMTCIPDYMVKHAALLGDTLTSLTIPAEQARYVLSLEVAPFVLDDLAVISRGATVAKALAVMERHDTTYLFVIDGNHYHGCISIMGIGESLIRYAEG